MDLVKEINETSIAEILVEGYSDSLGNEMFNSNLSLARALAVKKFLNQKLSNQNVKINALGFGESNPLFSNDPRPQGYES